VLMLALLLVAAMVLSTVIVGQQIVVVGVCSTLVKRNTTRFWSFFPL